MNSLGRTTAALIALASLLLTGCASESSSADGSGPAPNDESPRAFGDLDGRTFVSTQVRREGKPHRLASKAPIQLGFSESTLSANAGCNHLSGEGSVDADLLVITSMGGTEMGCEPALMKQDEWLVAFLTAGPTVDTHGNNLTLSSGDAKVELLDEEVANPDLSLTGTRWVLDSFGDSSSDHGVVSSVPSAPQSWLEIKGDQLRFHDTCNAGGARVEIGPLALRLGEVLKTTADCGPSDVTGAIAAVLRGEVKHSIEGDQLVLTKADTSLTYRGR
ncbi:MAG: META domain-containing protein [Nocardioidaceae bacterium]|nr:META domain-containing protein [Nocardioidaceae bacterium]